MLVDFQEGVLILTPESGLEEYALKQWEENNKSLLINSFGSLEQKIINLVKAGKKLQALRLVKDSKDWGLREAKDYLDKFIENHPLL